ncbi:hypothetical protein KPH14_007818 [Odynerus spinipes]|uniref:Ubiquitin carboxyl-terminal hydrolase n=1 Tax=Odynerus spinipes TaxID=1348599 RepID=A0AAD9S191_9HYME|nr:hypothetical protein KPH14_007818 [Odynerus spinipes]
MSDEMAWVPLESNPEVMTKFLHKLGVPEKWGIIDIYGLEPDLLAVVPKPVLAVILLYPESVKTELQNKEDEETKSKDNGKDTPDGVYHMKQIISNACGTVALIHSVANNMDAVNLKDGFLKSFLDESKDLSFAERGELLVNAQGIITTHKESAQEGQTEAPEEDTPVYYHFVAFIQKNGTLYELDGRKPAPVDHGSTTGETLLEDAARVCKEYMARDPSEMRFTVVALAASD